MSLLSSAGVKTAGSKGPSALTPRTKGVRDAGIAKVEKKDFFLAESLGGSPSPSPSQGLRKQEGALKM